MFRFDLSVFATFIELRLVTCVFLDKVRITKESRREGPIDDEIDASRYKEEDYLEETSTVTEELKHTSRFAGVDMLCWVRSQIETCISRAVRVNDLIILYSIGELKHLDGIETAKELPW